MKNRFYASLFLMVLLSVQSLFAYDFEVDGICYSFVSESEVGVSSKESGAPRYYYKGKVVIPKFVSYQGNTYKVTKILDEAFFYSTNLQEIIIPEGIRYIGKNAFAYCSLPSLKIPYSAVELYNPILRNSSFSTLIMPHLPFDDKELVLGQSSIKKVVIGNPKCMDVEEPFNLNFNASSYGLQILVCYLNTPPKINGTNFNSFKAYVPASRIEEYKKEWQNFLNKIELCPVPEDVLLDPQSAESYNEWKETIDCKSATSIGFLTGFDETLTDSIIKELINPNCLFFVPEEIEWQGSNIVKMESLCTNDIYIEANYPFKNMIPLSTDEIVFSYTPSVWADGQSGWDVITLPFEPTSIEASVSGSIVPITTNSKGNFWLRQYVGSSDDAVYFASTLDGVMKANTPYLIAFPGDKMGKGSLEGQTITFKAKNVTIPVTTIPSIQKNGYTFVGNYDKTADEGGGWTLNAEGSAFVWSETVGDKPFSGYFKGEAPVAGASALRMSFGQMDNATGLEQNMAELIDYADEVVYTLDGRKVIAKDLKPGLYIKNHKKMMVR